MIKLRDLAVLLTLPLAALPLACSSGSGSATTSGATTGTVSGNVLNPPNPVSGVTVTATGAGGSFSTTTSNTGAFTIEDVPVGDYSIALDGSGVFDSGGNAVPDKVSLEFTDYTIGAGNNVVGDKPIFLPEKAIGTHIDTAGSLTAVVPAGTVIENADLGISIVFEASTTITFKDSENTTISITEVALQHIPMALPSAVSSEMVVTIQPPGATFDVRPKVIFPNANGLPGGTTGVALYRFDHDTGDWVEFGTGTVSADGNTVISDPGQGLIETGWHGPTVNTFCTTTVSGNVQDFSTAGIEGVVVTTVNGITGITDINGDYSLPNVPLPSGTFNVIVTALPPNNAGYMPGDSAPVIGVCDGTTNAPNIALASLAIDTLAPTVISTSPAAGATGISDNSVVTINFSEIMSPGSLNASSITVSSDGTPIAGVIGVNVISNQSIATFLPTALLPLDSTIDVTIGTGAQDAGGNHLVDAVTRSFQTLITTSGGSSSIDATPNGPLAMDPGTTQQLGAAVLDAAGNRVFGPLVVWSSDSPNVASVDSTGQVTAIAPGSATITSTFGAATDPVVINVNTPVPTTVTVTPGAQTLAIGSVQQFTAEAFDAVPNSLAGVAIAWTSSSPSVATVDASGTVTALAAGSTTITATEPGTVFGTATLTVIDGNTVTSVTVTPAPLTIESGASAQLSAEAFDSVPTTVPGVSFAWTSSNDAIASVDSNGLVTGVAPGTATVTATATDSAIEGTSVVTVFENTSLVITLLGGDQEDDPAAGIRVFRNDSVTGAFIEERTTDAQGVADFGMIGTNRTTITLFFDYRATDMEADLTTLHNIEVGTYTVTAAQCNGLADFDIQVTGVPATSDIARVTSAGYSEGDDFIGFGSSPGITVFGIEACELQADGNASFIVMTEDSSTGTPTAAGFLLDQDPATLDGSTAPVLVSAVNLTSIPFTADAPTNPSGGFVQRNGVQFDQYYSRPPSPTTSGTAYLAIPPGANRLSLIFEHTSGAVEIGRELLFDTAPASVNVSVPVLDMPSFSRNTGTGEVSWTLSGSDVSGLDVVAVEHCYFDTAGNNICWDALIDKSETSYTPPSLPGNLASVTPPANGVGTLVESFGIDSVTDLDSLLSAAQSYSGNIDKMFLATATDGMFVCRSETSVTFSIGGTGTGAVTIDTGSGAVAVTDGQHMLIDNGSNVTVTATADATFNVTQMDCPFGPAGGLPSPSAQCFFGTGDTDAYTIVVSFD